MTSADREARAMVTPAATAAHRRRRSQSACRIMGNTRLGGRLGHDMYDPEEHNVRIMEQGLLCDSARSRPRGRESARTVRASLGRCQTIPFLEPGPSLGREGRHNVGSSPTRPWDRCKPAGGLQEGTSPADGQSDGKLIRQFRRLGGAKWRHVKFRERDSNEWARGRAAPDAGPRIHSGGSYSDVCSLRHALSRACPTARSFERR